MDEITEPEDDESCRLGRQSETTLAFAEVADGNESGNGGEGCEREGGVVEKAANPAEKRERRECTDPGGSALAWPTSLVAFDADEKAESDGFGQKPSLNRIEWKGVHFRRSPC